MITYLDTSALLKLYLDEPGSRGVRAVIRQAALCTHLIAWVEVHAGLAMAVRMGRLSDEDRADHAHSFQADWEALNIVGVDDGMVRRAGVFARQFGLRAYDSVHLAAAERVMVTVGSRDFVFIGFDAKLNDAKLNDAAKALGMALPVVGT